MSGDCEEAWTTMADLVVQPGLGRGVGMDQAVFQSVSYSVACQDCDAELECWGVQALVNGRLRWDVESTCSTCGFAVAVCGGAVPAERRDQMLDER